MFERYTESARRALFFARYEVSTLGGRVIGTEHLLLGLFRAAPGLVASLASSRPGFADDIRREIEARSTAREKVPTSVEVPFAADVKRILEFAVEEAERLQSDTITPEHLLAAILRDEESHAAILLASYGVRLDEVRRLIAS